MQHRTLVNGEQLIEVQHLAPGGHNTRARIPEYYERDVRYVRSAQAWKSRDWVISSR
jgi:hypothetical protein